MEQTTKNAVKYVEEVQICWYKHFASSSIEKIGEGICRRMRYSWIVVSVFDFSWDYQSLPTYYCSGTKISTKCTFSCSQVAAVADGLWLKTDGQQHIPICPFFRKPHIS